jgi:cell division inhibitor SepF
MSGGMRRIGEYLGLLEDTAGYDDESAYEAGELTRVGSGPRRERAAEVSQLSERRRPQAVPAAQELSRIVNLTPTTYNEARAVGEAFRQGIPVIMNLTEMDDADAKRLVDFAAGLVFATHGSIERITHKVFMLSPANVTVTAEQKARIATGGFFNQS